MKEWYIAKSERNREGWLKSSLDSLGVEVYYPYVSTYRRGKLIMEALFPTYLFCHIEIDSPQWWSTRYAPGLDCFLGEKGRPTPMAKVTLDYLRKRVDIRNSRKSEELEIELSDLQTSGIKNLKVLERVFREKMSGRQRCRAFFQAIGSLSPVEFDRAHADISEAVVE